MGTGGPPRDEAGAGLDQRLRHALSARADGWAVDGTDPSARQRVLVGIRRRRRRRLEAVGALGGACVVVVVGVLAVSTVSHSPSAGHVGATPSALGPTSTGPMCVQVQVASAAPRCAGSFGTASTRPVGSTASGLAHPPTATAPSALQGAGAAVEPSSTGPSSATGPSTDHRAPTAIGATANGATANGAATNGAATNGAAANGVSGQAGRTGPLGGGAAIVTGRVGQRVTITLPAHDDVPWSVPTSPPAPDFASAALGATRDAATSPTAAPGRTADTGRVSAGRTVAEGGSISVTYTLRRPGTVTLTARRGAARWSLVLRITP